MIRAASRRRLRPLFLVCLLALGGGAADVMSAEPHTEARVARADAPPRIDGMLDEIWRAAVPYELGHCAGGIDNLVVENYLTQVRLLWDEDCLYVLFVCRDTDLVATLTKRDDPVFSEEMCELVLRAAGSPTLYELAVSPRNVVFDARGSWDDDARLAMDATFDLEGLRTAAWVGESADGVLIWRVAMAIPWRALGIEKPRPGLELRGNLLRYERIVARPDLQAVNLDRELMALSLFGTHIRGWPAATASQRAIILE